MTQHLPDLHCHATARPHVQLLLVVKVVAVPREQIARILRVAHVHEAERANIRRVLMGHETDHLFARQLERVELVQEAVGRRDDATAAHAPHPAAHACQTLGLAAALLPRLQMLYSIVDFVYHFVISLELEEICLEVSGALNVGEDHAVEVHRVLVAPDLQDVRTHRSLSFFCFFNKLKMI